MTKKSVEIAEASGLNIDAIRIKGRDGFAPDPNLSQKVVWSRLIKLHNLLYRPFMAKFAEKYQLSITDWRLILNLAEMGEAAGHELCQATGMHPMNVSRSIASLRNQGRVVEARDPANRRRKIIKLTDEGWELYDTLAPHLKRFAEFMFSTMTHLETEIFGKIIDEMISRLEALDPDSEVFFDADALKAERARPPGKRPKPAKDINE